MVNVIFPTKALAVGEAPEEEGGDQRYAWSGVRGAAGSGAP